MTLEAKKLEELEQEAREKLRGVQLVCELGIDSDDDFFQECHLALNNFLTSEIPAPVRQLSADCPAVFVLTLTVIGAKLGNGGELWEPIMREGVDGLRLVGLDGTNSNKFGEQFRYSLQELGLPEFSHLQRRRNLGPILLHAGIPNQSAEEVWRKTLEFVRNGVSSGREIVQDLRGDYSHIRYFKKPAQSFVTESGAFAVDLIQRMANVVIATLEDSEISAEVLASRHGLPQGMVEAFTQADTETTGFNHFVPTAHIYLDTDSGMGPYCYLPPIQERAQDYLWSVSGRTLKASRFDSVPVQLEPSPSWTVEIMTYGRRVRARKFDSLTPEGSWLFVESGHQLRLLQNANDLEEGLYFLLAHKSQVVRVLTSESNYLAPVAETAGLGNSWSNYLVYEVDLNGAEQLCIEGADGHETKIGITTLPLRPKLVGQECQNVREVDGCRVFAAPPRIVFTGHGGEASQFRMAIRTPDGLWNQVSLETLALIDNEIGLDEVIEWTTGDYRIEITGPLGSGISEKLVVLLSGELRVDDRIFLPKDTVHGTLSYRKGIDSELTVLQAEFQPFKDRVFLKSTDDAVILEARIPRIAFDFGGVGTPPDFSRSVSRVMAIEDLVELRTQQLQLKTGRPVELELIMRMDDGEIFHRKSLTTSSAGYGVVEVSSLLDSIRLTGASETNVEVLIEKNLILKILTIQQTLDFQIVDTAFQIQSEDILGVVHVNVRVPANSPDASVCLQSLERVWEDSVEFPILKSDDASEVHLVKCPNIAPGVYSVSLSVGNTRRSIPSSRRKKTFGTSEDAERYRSSFIENPERLAEQIIYGKKAPRQISSGSEVEDVQKVTRFLLMNQRMLTTDSDVFGSCIDFLGREGFSRTIAEWLTQIGTQISLTRDIENFVVRLFPIFIDNPISDSEELDLSRIEEVDEVLISRLWTLSPIVGLAFTHQMKLRIVDELVLQMGEQREILNYEGLAELTWPALIEEVEKEIERGALFSRGYGLVSFLETWKQCWPNGRLDDSRLNVLIERTERGRALMSTLPTEKTAAMPPRIAETLPSQWLKGRKQENLAIAMFIHNLYRLSWLVSRVETPLEVALNASEILGESYGLAQGLSDRALALALLTERPRNS